MHFKLIVAFVEDAKTDAIMVGSGTALADDPELTARRGDRVIATPTRVLVDSRLRVSPKARLFDCPDRCETLVMTRASRAHRIPRVTARVLLVSASRASLSRSQRDSSQPAPAMSNVLDGSTMKRLRREIWLMKNQRL